MVLGLMTCGEVGEVVGVLDLLVEEGDRQEGSSEVESGIGPVKEKQSCG